MANETLADVIRDGMRRMDVDIERVADMSGLTLEDAEYIEATGTHPDTNKLYAVLLALQIRVHLPSSYRPPRY